MILLSISRSLGACIVCLAAVVTAVTAEPTTTTTLSLYHRTFSPSQNNIEIPWIPRGELQLTLNRINESNSETTAVFLPASGSHAAWDSLEAGDKYQVAIGQTKEEGEEERKSIVLLDSCILDHDPKHKFRETITLFLNAADEFTHFRYSTRDISACSAAASTTKLVRGPVRNAEEMVISIQRSMEIEPVHLRQPPPVIIGKDGKIVPPAKEKSFFEKYWVYAIPIVVLLLMPGADETPGAKEGGGGAAAKSE